VNGKIGLKMTQTIKRRINVNYEELFKRRELLNYALGCLSPREHKIFVERRLNEPPSTLLVVSKKYGLSRERIRQIEMNAFDKFKKP